LIPLVAWLVFLMSARMNYGFRHFLPAYVFILMWAGRAVAEAGWVVKALAWAGAAAGAVHGVWFHPDYLSYVNFPRERVWMQMTDSNLDWDQATRQIPRWLADHPHPQQQVHVALRSGQGGHAGSYYLGDHVHIVERGKPPPQTGILIISPVWVTGVYDDGNNPYEFLRELEPIDVIGHALLVYDLDARPKR
jgi:hypothetical protein